MKSLDDLLDDLAAYIDTPETACFSLPPDAYLSPELNALEVRAIFERSWLCVGREEYAPAPGDYYTIDVMGEPLVIVRGTDGVMRALNTACRHRAMPVVTGRGRARRLASVRLPGRLQVLQDRPWVVLDGAHNVLAAESLTDSLRDLFPARRAIVVLSAHLDKNVEELCAVIARYADEIVVPERRVLRKRQADPGNVAAACTRAGTPARTTPSVASALSESMGSAGPDDLVLVTGCFALVGEVLEVLNELEPEETASR